ncbi:MAG: sigma-70 family RNA polymerase sigma factor [Fusobacterium sp.]
MDSFEVEALIKAKSGDNESFEILLKKYEKYIYMNTKNYYLIDGEREDLIQEGMIGLLKGIKSFDFNREVSFKTFVIMCMRRQIISALKNSNSKKNQVLNVIYTSSDENIKEKIFKEKAPNAEEIFIYKELMQEFKTYSDKHFSNLEKNVLKYLIQGYSYGEIAEILEKSNKTIDNTYQRIKLKIKRWLKSLKNI